MSFTEAVEDRLQKPESKPPVSSLDKAVEEFEKGITAMYGIPSTIALDRFRQGKGGVSFYMDKDGTPVSELLKEDDNRIIYDGVEIEGKTASKLRSFMNSRVK